LLVSQAGMGRKTVNIPVSNQQVAATIIWELGFDPNQLRAVQKDQVSVLPFLFADGDKH
jgi:hypothetical protein